MANPFVHCELTTTDVAKAKRFYKGLFGWELTDTDMGGGMIYTSISVGEGTGGGMMQTPPGGPTAWMPHVDVDDIKASTEKAKAAGATVMRDVTQVAEMGWLSILVDPTGAMIGLWQTKKK